MTDTFDYIIVGAGSAGCVLAGKLTEDSACRVLLLEAGPSDTSPLIHIPFGIGRLHPQRRFDWGYNCEPEESLNGRALSGARGKVVGGSSSINSMAYVRGNPADYDRWEKKGAIGWGYESVLPYFIQNECWAGAEPSNTRGRLGPLGVERTRDTDPLYDAWRKSIAAAGYKLVDDYNSGDQEGFSRIQFSLRNGRRSSAASAFLVPARRRQNLALVTEAMATRILLDGRRATGVEYIRGGTVRKAIARREVLICGGTFNSPHLLMLSGIGPAAHLKQHGIDVVIDAPGVGANLQDHLCGLISYRRTVPGHFVRTMRFDRMAMAMLQAHFLGRGPATLLPVGMIGHIKTRPELDAPDIQFILRGVLPDVHLWFPGIKPPFADGFGIRPVLLHPKSRGRLELRSADPYDMLKVRQNFLSDEGDIATLREGVRIARKVTTQLELDGFRGEEISPGERIESDHEIDQWLRATVITAHHPTSTCAMGDGKQAVLNPNLQVRGIERLRVVDASAMPDLPSGNTNAPTMMIAARAVDLIHQVQ